MKVDREVEQFVWDALCAVADAYGNGVSPLMMMGHCKSPHQSKALNAFFAVIHKHLYCDGCGFVVVFGEPQSDLRRISYPQMSYLFGRNHTVYVRIRLRYNHMKGQLSHVVEQAEDELAEKWSMCSSGLASQA